MFVCLFIYLFFFFFDVTFSPKCKMPNGRQCVSADVPIRLFKGLGRVLRVVNNLAFGEQTFFGSCFTRSVVSRRVKQEPKKASAPRRLLTIKMQVLHKTSHKGISRRNCAEAGKKWTKKVATHAKFLFLLIKAIAFSMTFSLPSHSSLLREKRCFHKPPHNPAWQSISKMLLGPLGLQSSSKCRLSYLMALPSVGTLDRIKK